MNINRTGVLIAEERKRLGLTQENLGSRLGVTAKAVSKWERGLSYPDITLIGRLANELNISVVELLSGEKNRLMGCYSGETVDMSDIAPDRNDELTLNFEDSTGFIVSPFLFGENLEHTRSNIYMGLSAQMLRNRKFAGKPVSCRGYSLDWYPIGEKTFYAHSEPYTRHSDRFYHMKRINERHSQQIINLYGGLCGLGQHGLSIQKDTDYEFRIVAKSTVPVSLHVALTSRGGAETIAVLELHIDGNDWISQDMTLHAVKSDEDADLRLSFEEEGCLTIGCVSLMKEGHFKGMRRDVIDLLREMGIHILRWPGGNFAGEYCWHDGLLPVDMRAPLASYQEMETQPHSLGYDFHEINTDDFIALCREIGAEPFITINPTWNTPEENAAWVEYCNGSADTQYGALRAERGHVEPYAVHFWSLGNEFGYGHMEGDNTPYGYSRLAMENAKKMLAVSDKLCLCSSGPYPNDEWAAHAAIPLSVVAQLVSLHYYAPSPSYIDPTTLEKEYYQCLAAVEIARNKLYAMRSILREPLKISFDEWNTWYAWYRPSSIVDGLFTAMMLHVFIQEAESVGIVVACHFEAINEGMIEVYPDGAALTASGQAFSLVQRHAGGRLLYASADAVVSEKNDEIIITAINPSFGDTRKINIPGRGALTEAVVYTAERIAPFTRFKAIAVQATRDNDIYTFNVLPHSLLFVQFRVK